MTKRYIVEDHALAKAMANALADLLATSENWKKISSTVPSRWADESGGEDNILLPARLEDVNEMASNVAEEVLSNNVVRYIVEDLVGDVIRRAMDPKKKMR